MTGDKRNDARGIIFDLLAEDHLTGTEVRILQSSLNEYNNKGGVQISRINGVIGPETCNSIISVLRNNPLMASRLGDAVKNILFDEGFGFDPPADGSSRQIGFFNRDINSFLMQEYPLSKDEMSRLQLKLGIAEPTGEMGPDTARAIIGHLDRNPAVIENINFSLLRQLTERSDQRKSPDYDSRKYLSEVCRKSPGFVRRVDGLIAEIKEPSKISPQAYAVQILLKAARFGIEQPDGSPGEEFGAAVDLYRKEMHKGSSFQQAWKQSANVLSPDGPKASTQPAIPDISRISSLPVRPA